MKRLILPLCALALLAGACSSTKSAKNTTPVPAKSVGVADTRWGNLPVYTADQGKLVLDYDPRGLVVPKANYRVEVDLLVDRDGTVRDVALRKGSGDPTADAIFVKSFKKSRSLLALAPADPAPYVIQWALNINYTSDDSLSDIPVWGPSDYRSLDQRPMGTGEPTPRERGY